MNKDRSLKITVVGDGTVGKTCILVTYTKKKFPKEYVPTVLDYCLTTVEVDGLPYNVSLWDTAGQEDYETLRVLSYPNTDVFLLCYAVDNRISFNNVTSKWIEDITDNCPNTPVVLVGTKVDIRKDGEPSANFVSYKEGVKASKKMDTFIECSASTGENLGLVFEEAVRTALKSKQKSSNCAVL